MDERYVAIYCRVSSDKQSTASQKPDLKRWVDVYCHDQTVIWYEDTSNDHIRMDRTQWNKLHEDIRAGKVAKLVVWKLDRLGRSASKLTSLFEELRRNGTSFYSLRDGMDLETPTGRMMATILSSVAEWELENISLRIRAGQQRRRELGLKRKSRAGIRIKVTDGMIREIGRLRTNGLTWKSIAEEVGLSYSHVRKLARLHLPEIKPLAKHRPKRPRKKHRKFTMQEIRILQNMHANNESVTYMAKVLKCTRQHVYGLIRMYISPEETVRRTSAEFAVEKDPDLAVIAHEDWGIRIEDLIVPDDKPKEYTVATNSD